MNSSPSMAYESDTNRGDAMNDPTQLAAEAADCIMAQVQPDHGKIAWENEKLRVKAIIHTAIKKAVEEMKQLEEWLDSATVPRTDKDGREFPLSERVALAIAITESEASRAAHASEQVFYCDKCGYFGSTKEHQGCNYNAQPPHASEKGVRIGSVGDMLCEHEGCRELATGLCAKHTPAHTSEQGADTKRGIEQQILEIIDKYNEAEDVPAVDALRDIEALVR